MNENGGREEGVFTRSCYDVIVVGGGHAGCEAAHAVARLDLSTLMITLREDRIGWMSCNPAVGGVGKGHLVREIDALGGLMAQVTDWTGIQFRTLNRSRGLAVRGSRAQCDRRLYASSMRSIIHGIPSIEVLEGLVEDVVMEGDGEERRVVGVRTEEGEEIGCRALVLTTGTFLNGVAHVGHEQIACGREGERPALTLSDSLRGLGLVLGRFKTGTTPRLDGRTIDLKGIEVQPGDEDTRPFSSRTDRASFPRLPQIPCHLTRTNRRTHEVVRKNTRHSVVSRMNESVIPTRYCPSIEEKVRRFPDREGHRVYLEPEGLDTHEVYPAGLSTSLPLDLQLEFLRTIRGLEEVEILRPGYAIEYDYLVPYQLTPTLSIRGLRGLYSAGQINGTSGYEEAAAQGLVAGINAGRWLKGENELVLGREQSYIGVLISDLTTVGTAEPYRMFTSRAEHRLLLREDNADMRLCREGWLAGLVSGEQLERVKDREARVAREVARLERTMGRPGADEPQSRGRVSLATLLRRPECSYEGTLSRDPNPDLRLSGTDADTVEAEIKYAGYISRSRRRLERLRELDNLAIPTDFDYSCVPSLSSEVREKLWKHRPSTVGQASRISGVTPAAVEVLSASVLRLARACG